jgi:hypothetical protein
MFEVFGINIFVNMIKADDRHLFIDLCHMWYVLVVLMSQ